MMLGMQMGVSTSKTSASTLVLSGAFDTVLISSHLPLSSAVEMNRTQHTCLAVLLLYFTGGSPGVAHKGETPFLNHDAPRAPPLVTVLVLRLMRWHLKKIQKRTATEHHALQWDHASFFPQGWQSFGGAYTHLVPVTLGVVCSASGCTQQSGQHSAWAKASHRDRILDPTLATPVLRH